MSRIFTVSMLVAMLFVVGPSIRQDNSAQAQSPTAQPSAPPAQAVPAFPGSELFNNTPPFLVNVSVDHQDQIYREGDRLVVHFKSERESHMYLIYHQSDGRSLLLIPNSAQKTNRLPAATEVSIPAAGSGFHIRIQPPLGMDVLQVVATVQPLADLDALAQTVGTPVILPGDFAKLCTGLLKDRSTWTEHRQPIKTVASSAPPTERDPQRFALLVGVDQYQDQSVVKPRSEFRNAAVLLADTLGQRGQMAPQGVKVLSGEQATRANFEAAITGWLAGATQPGDTVFIGFCGYVGSVTESAGPGAKATVEQFFIPYDNAVMARPASPEQMQVQLRERMMFGATWLRWLQALPGRRIVLLCDVCQLELSSQDPVSVAVVPKDLEIARLKDVSTVQIALWRATSLAQAAYFTSGPNSCSWSAQLLCDAMTKLPAPLTLSQAYEYVKTNWETKLSSAANRPASPSLTALPPQGVAIELVPAARQGTAAPTRETKT